MKKGISICCLGLLLTACGTSNENLQDIDEFTVSSATVISSETSTLTSEAYTSPLYVLSEFTIPQYSKISEDPSMTVSIDDTEIIELIDNSFILKKFFFDFVYSKNFDNMGEVTDSNGNVYYRSGLSYDSFINALNSCFTEEYTNALLDNTNPRIYVNIDGELCFRYKDGEGSRPGFGYAEWFTESVNENELAIICTVCYYNNDDMNDKDFEKYTSYLTMTENGWRFKSLEIW
ncbi:MAG: hypothetical protein ACI4I1_08040 [Oscillospiraceae bacterium]